MLLRECLLIDGIERNDGIAKIARSLSWGRRLIALCLHN
jgi:hypothetical protein